MRNLVARAVLLTLFVTGAFVYEGQNNSAEAANALKTGPSSRVDLEVINRHFTVGKKMRSVYLRVFSDGTAECHTEKYWGETDVVKRKVLAPEDFERLKSLLAKPELLSAKRRYGLMVPVIDPGWSGRLEFSMVKIFKLSRWTISIPRRLLNAKRLIQTFL
jgi:hypothetical protein